MIRALFTLGCLLLALGFTLFTSDPWATLAKLRGETLAVLPPVTNLGQGTAGEQRTFQIQLHNYSDKPIKVVGGTTTCSCIATQDLPITIPAGGTHSINVKIKFSGSPGKFAHRFVLYSDSDERLTVARFSGSVSTPTAKVATLFPLSLPGRGVRGEGLLLQSAAPFFPLSTQNTITINTRQHTSHFEKPPLADFRGGVQ